MSGYAWNQANPVENFYELKKNIEANREKIQKVNMISILIFADIATHPIIAPLIKTNINLFLKYLSLQIQWNSMLNNKFGGYLPILKHYYKLIIFINEYYQNYFKNLLNVLEKNDRDILVNWLEKNSKMDMTGFLDILKKLMVDTTVDYLDYLKEVVQGKKDFTSLIPQIDYQGLANKGLENLTKGNLTPEQIKNAKDFMLGIHSDLSKKVDDMEKRINEPKTPIKKQKGGVQNNLYNKIFDPIQNKWINIESNRGQHILNNYIKSYIEK